MSDDDSLRERVDDLEERNQQLEQTVRKMLPDRRGVLKGLGAAALGGAAVGASTGGASGQSGPAGKQGTPENPNDMFAWNLDVANEVVTDLPMAGNDITDAAGVNAQSVSTDDTITDRLQFDRSQRYPQSPRQPEVDSPLTIRPHRYADNPIIGPSQVDDVNAEEVADAFPRWDPVDEEYKIFAEIIKDNGDVCVGHWTLKHPMADPDYVGVAIPSSQREHTHPKFEIIDGTWYMFPSPPGDGPYTFTIYERGDSWTDWTLVQEYFDDVRNDPNPFKWDGTWYVPYQQEGTLDIILKYADGDNMLDTTWSTHPESPNPGTGTRRVSGDVIPRNDYLEVFRRVGTSRMYNVIWELDENSLSETVLKPLITLTDSDWRETGMHHVGVCFGGVTGDGFALVDGKNDTDGWRVGLYEFGTERAILKAWPTASQTASSGSEKIIEFSTSGPDTRQDIDDGTGVDVTNNKFVIPQSGYYLVRAKARLLSMAADANITVKLLDSNGSRIDWEDNAAISGKNQTGRVEYRGYFRQGDEIQGAVEHDSGSDQEIAFSDSGEFTAVTAIQLD